MRPTLAVALLASLFAPATAALASSSDSTTSASNVRISTGITSPKLLNSGDVRISAVDGSGPAAVLDFTVDETGSLHDVRVVSSASPAAAIQALKAAHQFKFAPAQLDGRPVPIDLELRIMVQR